MMVLTEADKTLAGLRILVVEDNFLVASALARRLTSWGCVVLGPVGSVEEGRQLLKSSERLNGGILDINITGGTSAPIAQEMESRGCPFFFITGYASPMALPEHLKSHRRLQKPLDEATLRSAIVQEFGAN
ncbi:MAG: response regulator [Phycisphaerales bacterium]|nr:MAG: response regulator [Phycisphaerales bacterium]